MKIKYSQRDSSKELGSRRVTVAGSKNRTKRSHLFRIALIALLISPAGGALSQQAARTPTTGEEEINKARKANEEAQTEYYRELTNKLRQPTPSPSPSPEKNFRQSITENPTSVLGVMGVVLAALFAALVGLLTLYVNSRNALRAQRDTQFYEGLKRFGDESATIRSSAAGILGQMGPEQVSHLFRKWRKDRPYYVTALGQLITGLMLEANLVALKSIGDAIEQLIPYDPKNATRRLFEANIKIQENMANQLALFFVLSGYKIPPNPLDKERHWEDWEPAASLTVYHRSTLMDFVKRYGRFEQFFNNHLRAASVQSEKEKTELLVHTHRRMWASSHRLQLSAELSCKALARCHWDSGERPNFGGAFLVGGSGIVLMSADLRFVNLSSSQLTGLFVYYANLSDAAFIGADLKGAGMHGATLRGTYLNRAELDGAGLEKTNLADAKLAQAHINSTTNFKDANWWEADFYLPTPPDAVDATLLEHFHQNYGEGVPDDPSKLHPSVREFVAAKRQKARPSGPGGIVVKE